jgi:tight adherence protein B
MDNAFLIQIICFIVAFIVVMVFLYLAFGIKSNFVRRTRLDEFLSGEVYQEDLRQLSIEKQSNKIMENMKALEEKRKYEKSFIGKLQPLIMRAGLKISLKKFIIFFIGLGFVFFEISSQFHLPVIINFLVFIMTSSVLPIFILKTIIIKRQNNFIKEFPNALDMLVRGVKSGMSPSQCFIQISKEIPGPCGEEFVNIVNEVQAGITLSNAIYRSYDRIKISELKFFACVISIQQQTGGNLAEIVQNIVNVMRGRVQLQNKAKALASEAKAQTIVLGSMPFFIVGLIAYVNYSYISLLWTTPIGKIILGVSLTMMLIGIMIMKKISKIDM